MVHSLTLDDVLLAPRSATAEKPKPKTSREDDKRTVSAKLGDAIRSSIIF